MGANLIRALKNFNVESRAHRLIGKDKPSAAPMHPSSREAIQAMMSNNPDIQNKIHKRDDQLLSRLKDVFVDSTDPSPQVIEEVPTLKQESFRPPKYMMRNESLGITVDSIPKGKISIIEALTILSNHKKSPNTWTPEKIAGEYSLDVKDAKAIVTFFTPFDIQLITSSEKEKIAEK